MKNQVIWRDDDVSCHTNLKQFSLIHDLFEKHKVKHRISIIAEGLDKRKDLIEYILKHPLIDPQLHCFTHLRFDELNEWQLSEQFTLGFEMFDFVGLEKPVILHPPWNAGNYLVEKVAGEFGLTVSNKKISLSQYLRGAIGEAVNFHYWSDECKDLEPALIKYKNHLNQAA